MPIRFGSMKPCATTVLTAGMTHFSALSPGVARLVDDVGHQHDVAVADVARDVDARARVRRAVAVQALGQLLVDVDHQRVLLRRIEVVGLGDDRAQGLAVGVDVLHQLGLAPDVLALLGVGVRDLLHVAEARIADPQIRELVEPRLREDDAVGGARLDHRAERLVDHHDLLGRGGAAIGDAVEAAALASCRRWRRAASACRSESRALRGRASGSGRRSASCVRHRRSTCAAPRAVGLDFPDVVLVVEQDRRVLGRPAGRHRRPAPGSGES